MGKYNQHINISHHHIEQSIYLDNCEADKEISCLLSSDFLIWAFIFLSYVEALSLGKTRFQKAMFQVQKVFSVQISWKPQSNKLFDGFFLRSGL